MNILDYLGSLFGYIIFFGYKISGVYVVGILLFTIAVRLVMLPSSLKQQKTSAKQARLAPKIKELQEMYKNNPQKMQEEQQKLYARENANPMSGCLPLLIQFPVIIGLYSAITKPLMCVLHMSVDKVNAALQLVGLDKAGYGQLDFISKFASLREQVVASNIFDATEIAELDGLANGAFNLFGINLLGTPSFSNISMLILIPILCFVSSMAMSLIMNKTSAQQQTGGGCMKWGMPIFMSVFSTAIAFSVPGAVGLYWIFSNLASILQTVIMNKYYNMWIMNAQEEAARYARRENEESAMLAKFGGVNIRAAFESLRKANEAAAQQEETKPAEKAKAPAEKSAPYGNDKVIKTGNAARAGQTAQKKKK